MGDEGGHKRPSGVLNTKLNRTIRLGLGEGTLTIVFNLRQLSTDAPPRQKLLQHSPAVRHAARNPTVKHCLGNKSKQLIMATGSLSSGDFQPSHKGQWDAERATQSGFMVGHHSASLVTSYRGPSNYRCRISVSPLTSDGMVHDVASSCCELDGRKTARGTRV